jgi:signal recognition particle GTPase
VYPGKYAGRRSAGCRCVAGDRKIGRRSVAAGCGMRVQDVNKLLKNFEESKKMMKKMQGMAKFASKGGFKMPFMNK